MGLPNTVNQLFNGGSPYYIVNRSLRFRSSASAYLNRTPSASNRRTWTWSAWIKRGQLARSMLFCTPDGNYPSMNIEFQSDSFWVQDYDGATNQIYLTSSAVLRDPSAWYHLLLSIDTTQATSSNRAKMYINGVQVTAFGTSNYPTQNYEGGINRAVDTRLGAQANRASSYFDGYMAEVNFIDGQALTPSSFGAFDTNGIWQPIRYAGTYGTNGFYLPFNNTTSTTTLVADASGNGNNWTPNNISLTAGTTYDSMLDSPTNSNVGGNFCVLNPLNRSTSALPATIVDGNLKLTTTTSGAGSPGAFSYAFSTFAMQSGKYYAEFIANYASGSAGSTKFGLTNNFTFNYNGGNYIASNFTSAYTQVAPGTIVQIAYDATNGLYWFGTNGTFTGDPAAGTGGTSLTAPAMFFVEGYNDSVNRIDVNANFGQRPFTYTPPSGYNALNTANLPQPTISYGAPYMNAVTYTGYGPLIPSGLGIPTKRNASTQNVSKSLRFRASASAYLNRTFSTPTNNKIWTWSGWAKRGSTGSRQFLSSTNTTGGSNAFYFEYDSSDAINIGDYGASWTWRLMTTQVFKDPTAWHHIVLSVDTTQATASNRVKLYVNGIEVTAFSTATYPSQNSNPYWNSATYSNIGNLNGTSLYFDGYLAELNFIDGQALTPSSFGETNSDGVWVPKSYTGTYGTNGFYLPFTNTTSTTTLVADSSGNGNNWTPNNISLTAGTTYDSMIDSPTDYASAGNYCTMNPLDSLSGTASNGNLLWTAGAAQSDIRGTITIPSSGKFYMECTVGSTTNATSAVSFGLATSTVALNSSNAVSGLYQLYASSSGYLSLNGTNVSSSLGVWTAGDTLQIAVDVDNTKMWLGKNGTWYDSAGGSTGNPSTGANATSTASMVGLFPFSNCYSNNATWNMGQRSFVYAAPTGFTTLNTYNITAPSKTWFSSANNSGRGSATAYPDFVWIKSRSSAQNHSLNDTLRGPTLNLITNNVNVEAGASTMFNVNKYGLTLGNDASVNSSSYTDVMWGWQAGQGTTSTNTSGSITSTVSASPSSGFSILTYTGNFTAGATVGHGLGVAPSMILVKTRTQASVDWITYHVSLGPTKGLYMDTGAATTSAIFWNNTSPTSSVITLGGGAQSNGNAQNMVAYCWAAVRGYSAFGSYTGNGSSDGVFVFTNFRSRFVMVKRTDTSGQNWVILDTSRNTYNVTTTGLYPNLSNAEDSGWNVDILSNGFKTRDASSAWNASGGTYIYAAFAENPFQIARAR